jgi:hypothetical protein
MRTTRKILVSVLTVCTIGYFVTTAQADWVKIGMHKDGFPVYADTNTGLKWTVTLGKVTSADRGNIARARVNALGPGWRLPTFVELQRMYNQNGGGPVLNIRTDFLDYYETADPNILGNANGNGFQTPLQRLGVGDNWYIAVHP